jgi:hypothetical protein
MSEERIGIFRATGILWAEVTARKLWFDLDAISEIMGMSTILERQYVVDIIVCIPYAVACTRWCVPGRLVGGGPAD